MPRHSPYALYSLNSFVLVLYKLLFAIYCLSFVSIISILDCFSRLWKSYAFFYLEFFSTLTLFLWLAKLTLSWRIVVIHDSWKDRLYWIKFNLLITVFLNYLFVLLFCFIRFSMNICVQNTFVFCWWAQMDSNHRPRAYQARALATWAMSP